MLKERTQKVVLQATESIYHVYYTLSVSLRLIQNSSVENEGVNRNAPGNKCRREGGFHFILNGYRVDQILLWPLLLTMLGEDLDQHHTAFKNPSLDQYADKASFLYTQPLHKHLKPVTFNSKTVGTVTKLS